MICERCANGDHCGPLGAPGLCGVCQHRPPGTGQTVCQYGCLHEAADHKPGQGCTHTGCHCLAGAQYPVKVRKEVAISEAYVYTKVDVHPALIAGCRDTDECCPGDTCRLDAARAALNAPSRSVAAPLATEEAIPVVPDPEDPTAASDARLADLLNRWQNNREASGS